MATITATRDGGMVTLGDTCCTLDRVIEAAMQADADLAAEYRAVLAAVAPQLHLVIVREFDGDRQAGCHWYAIQLTDGLGGETLTRPHQLTRREYRGLGSHGPAPADVTAEILRRAAEIGLAEAGCTIGGRRKVADAV